MRVLLVLLLVGAAAPAAQVRRDTLALGPGQRAALLSARPIVGTETVALFRDSVFVPLAPADYTLDGTGRLELAPSDTVRYVAIAYRAAPVVGPVRAQIPSVDSLRALYAPDTTGRRRAPPSTRPPPAIRTSGSITRGVVAGSNRDVSVTSALRLSLEGEVAPGVALRAALTDEDTPILPEGTTRQLSDLDRVYVEVDGPGVRARLGDVDLALPGTAFAPLSRQVQGAVVETRIPAAGVVRGGRVLGSASATRGRFRSQDLAPAEGVQGPYRLEGEAGEAFVIVVPGSERVFLDGRLLARGASADYTIDYGTGEVTFTPAHLITAERRITVDFEYSSGGFTQTLVASGVDLELGRGDQARGSVGVRVYREADAIGSATDLGLGDAELDLIRAAGDAPVLVPGEQPVPFDAESPFVLYTRRDTTEVGQPVTIFVPARPGDAEVFRVRFTRVGAGQGDYRRGGAALNGILYEYVGPGRGDFVPFRILPRPASRTLVDARGAVTLVPGVQAFGELARSVDDGNTLSDVGDGDDGAGAFETGLRLAAVPLGGGALTGQLALRQRADDFRPLDRVRGVDFNRRWNLARGGTPFGSALDTLGESTTEGVLAWAREGVTAEAQAGRLVLADLTSSRAALAATIGDERRSLVLEGAATATSGDGPIASQIGTGAFRRAQTVGAVTLGAFRPSLGFEHERRSQSGVFPQDSLLSASYSFLAIRPGLGVASGGSDAQAFVELRRESEPLALDGGESFADAATALTVEASGRAVGGTFQTEGRLGYRRKRYTDAFREQGRSDAESVALRLASRGSVARGALDGRVVYDALTERAPILQETFVRVGQDLGEYVWRDGEGEPRAGEPDGVAQLDEFFPETTPLEGTYLRTFVPGTDLVPTVGVGLGLRMDARPGRLTTGDGPLASVFRAVALRTVVDVRETTRERDVLRVLLLDPAVLQQPDLDAGTVDGRFRVDQDVILFPDLADRGGRLALSHAQSTARLAAGLERRLVQTARAEAFAPLAPTLDARLAAVASRRRTLSEAFASRTFDIGSVGAEGSVRWAPSPRVEVSVAPTLSTRTDALAGPGRPTGAFVARVPLEARWTRSGRFTAAARVEGSSVSLRGAEGGGLSLFELTDGRGPGLSAIWGVDAQIGLTERVRGSLVYDGRAPAGSRVIQTVRVQLSAAL
ncbi:hypothetical protein [Rubrivirga sp. IMCC45206]|uniref:hypothetical protein n=1 Tax=Rubrivirga sp. IMCC45206 TaxID=3391614 RepID=UPI00399018D9